MEVTLGDTSSGSGNTADTTATNGTTPIDSIQYSFSIYPNPVHDFLYFTHNVSFEGTGQLALFDITGRKLLDAEVPEANGVTTINLKNLPASVYILSIDYDHQVRKIKIVKS